MDGFPDGSLTFAAHALGFVKHWLRLRTGGDAHTCLVLQFLSACRGYSGRTCCFCFCSCRGTSFASLRIMRGARGICMGFSCAHHWCSTLHSSAGASGMPMPAPGLTRWVTSAALCLYGISVGGHLDSLLISFSPGSVHTLGGIGSGCGYTSILSSKSSL